MGATLSRPGGGGAHKSSLWCGCSILGVYHPTLGSLVSAYHASFLPLVCAGASLCATDNRLYLFGGHDGHGPLNDCAYLEVEQLCWSVLQPTGTPPEPREAHTAAVLGGRYLVVSGGCGVTAAPTATGTAALGSTAASGSSGAAGAAAAATAGLMGQPSAADSASTAATAAASGAAAVGGAAGAVPKRLTDTFVLDMFSGPCWEQLHDGGSVNAMWLKQVGTCL